MVKLLVLQPLTPISLLDELHATYGVDNVAYAPARPFEAPSDDCVLPTDKQLHDAEVIMGFVIPSNLTNFAKQCPNLKLWQALSAGCGHLTSHPAWATIPAESPLIFASASGLHVSTIGEHCLATTISLFHKLHIIFHQMRTDQTWFHAENQFGRFIREIRGMTVGIAGYGTIGRETARLFAAAGATVVALNRAGKSSAQRGFILDGTGDSDGSIPQRYYSTEDSSSTLQFFSACDVVVSTLPNGPDTRGFVDEAKLKAMKGNAVFVNIGRGTTVVQDKLVQALKGTVGEGEADDATGTLRIGGASLDVVDPEPLPAGHELYTLDNVLLTPHMSGLAASYFVRGCELLRQNVSRLEAGKGALNAFRGKGED